MTKLTAEDVERLDDKIEPIRQWGHGDRLMKKFERNANGNTFKYLFEDGWERLWNNFTSDCGYKIDKFLTYLDNDQKNMILLNIFLNDKELYWR